MCVCVCAGSNSSFKYSFTDWTTEDLHMPRVMGDATILPNGDVVLLNGAQVCDLYTHTHTHARARATKQYTCTLGAHSSKGTTSMQQSTSVRLHV